MLVASWIQFQQHSDSNRGSSKVVGGNWKPAEWQAAKDMDIPTSSIMATTVENKIKRGQLQSERYHIEPFDPGGKAAEIPDFRAPRGSAIA